jgi:hypothetical protein
MGSYHAQPVLGGTRYYQDKDHETSKITLEIKRIGFARRAYLSDSKWLT